MTQDLGDLQQAAQQITLSACGSCCKGNRHPTVWMIASELSVDKNSVWKIITEELRMCKICAKMVPKLLSDEQKDRRVLSTRTSLSTSKPNMACSVES